MKQHRKSLYMHLIDGQPAYFDGDQVVYAWHGVPVDAWLVHSLKIIRRQQAASSKFREGRGFGVLGYLSYLRVKA